MADHTKRFHVVDVSLAQLLEAGVHFGHKAHMEPKNVSLYLYSKK